MGRRHFKVRAYVGFDLPTYSVPQTLHFSLLIMLSIGKINVSLALTSVTVSTIEGGLLISVLYTGYACMIFMFGVMFVHPTYNKDL